VEGHALAYRAVALGASIQGAAAARARHLRQRACTQTAFCKGALGLLADKSLSTERLSEYPTDYFLGIRIETSAMAEQNTLRLPRADFSDCCVRLLPLEE
jgi:hypothetical protein